MLNPLLATSSVPAPTVTAPSASRSLRLLVAEDDSANQKLITYLLEKAGHQVQPVRNGLEALRSLQSSPSLFDVVLMDIEMPEMDGRVTTATIRELEAKHQWPAIPIIALTAHITLAEQQRILTNGFNAILAKPINPPDLHAVLAKFAGGGIGSRPA